MPSGDTLSDEDEEAMFETPDSHIASARALAATKERT